MEIAGIILILSIIAAVGYRIAKNRPMNSLNGADFSLNPPMRKKNSYPF